MKRNPWTHIAISALAIGLATSGCSSLGIGKQSAAEASSNGKQAEADARSTSKSLARAENAVEAQPQDASLRYALGQQYMGAGRFTSAENSFAEAFALQKDGRTALNYALAQISNGRQYQAVQMLDEYREQIPAADYGLALALAGELERAVLVLNDAARSADATPRTRQNLAFVYAMGGRWLEAKVIAAQDMPNSQLDSRMTKWADMMQTRSPQMVVAGLMGAPTGIVDSGMPSRLALNVSQSDFQLASAPSANDPAPLAQYAPSAPAETPIVPVETAPAPAPQYAAVEAEPEAAPFVPAPVEVEQAAVVSDAVEEKAAPAQTIAAVKKPYKVAAKIGPAKRATAAKASAKLAPARKVTNQAEAQALVAKARKSSGYAVQLGAYSSMNGAKAAWKKLSRTKSSLRGYTPSYTVAKVRGKTYYRLAANGVASRKVAAAVCRSVTGSATVCATRDLQAKSSVQYARKKAAPVKAPVKAKVQVAAKKPAAKPAQKIASR